MNKQNMISLLLIIIFCSSIVSAESSCGSHANWNGFSCVCDEGYIREFTQGLTQEIKCVPNNAAETRTNCGINEYYDEYSGECIENYETPPEDPDDICGVNEHKDESGYCICDRGYTTYDAISGCEPIFCGENAHYEFEADECFCDEGYGVNAVGKCVPYDKAFSNQKELSDLDEKSQKRIVELISQGQNAKTRAEQVAIEEKIQKILQGLPEEEKFWDDNTNKKDARPKRIKDTEVDSETKEQLMDYSKHRSIGRIQEKNKVFGKNSISLKKARRISEDAFAPEAKRIQETKKIINDFQKESEKEDDKSSKLNTLIDALNTGNEAQKETAKILKAQKDKIDDATKKGKIFLENINKILKYSKRVGISKNELKKFDEIKGNIENMLGQADEFSGKLGAAHDKLDILNKLLEGDLGTYADLAEDQLKNYDGMYKGLTKTWLGRVKGIKAVNGHFEKIQKGDFEGMIKDFNKVIKNKNLPSKMQNAAKRMKLFTNKIQQAKKLGMKIKADEIFAYYKDVAEVQQTLRGGAGKTAAGMLGFTRLVDILADRIKIPLLGDAIKTINNAPKKMIEFAVKYQQHKIECIDKAEVGLDVSRESAISVFLEKNTNKKIEKVGKMNKAEKSVTFTFEYEFLNPKTKLKEKKKIAYKENIVKFIKKKGDKEDFIYPVNVDADYENVGDIIFKVKDEPIWKIFSCNKMEIYTRSKPHKYLGDRCI